MKKILLLLATSFIIASCSSQGSVNDDRRIIRQRVVAVQTEGNTSILSTGRYDNWYKVETPLVEGMMYNVTLEIPRQREETQIISAILTDFSPDGYMQRDVFSTFEMAYNQLKTVSK